MNKSDLVNAISNIENQSITKSKANEIVESILNSIQEAVSRGERVTLVGFGTFESYKRKARVGRNPQNGQEISIPEKMVVKFRAGKAFSEAVDQ